MVRMFWLLLGVYGFVTTLHGQWQELDAALTEQVNSGWLSGQERPLRLKKCGPSKALPMRPLKP